MASNSTSTVDYWTQLLNNYTIGFKYFFPFLGFVSTVVSTVLIFLLIYRREETRFQASTAIAIACLLFYDICNLLIAMLPMYMYTSFSILTEGYNDLECQVYTIFMYFVSTMPGYVQGFISIERVIAVTNPLRVKEWVTRKRMIAAILTSSVLVFALSTWLSIYTYKLNAKGECRGTQEQSTTRMIFDFVVWVSIPSSVQLICTVGIIIQLIRRLKLRSVTNAKERLTTSEIKLSVMLIVMDIIYIFGTSFFTFLTYHMHLYAAYDSHTFFIFEIAYFSSCLGSYTDWIFILCLGTSVRKAFKGIFGFLKRKTRERDQTFKNTMKTSESSLNTES